MLVVSANGFLYSWSPTDYKWKTLGEKDPERTKYFLKCLEMFTKNLMYTMPYSQPFQEGGVETFLWEGLQEMVKDMYMLETLDPSPVNPNPPDGVEF